MLLHHGFRTSKYRYTNTQSETGLVPKKKERKKMNLVETFKR